MESTMLKIKQQYIDISLSPYKIRSLAPGDDNQLYDCCKYDYQEMFTNMPVIEKEKIINSTFKFTKYYFIERNNICIGYFHTTDNPLLRFNEIRNLTKYKMIGIQLASGNENENKIIELICEVIDKEYPNKHLCFVFELTENSICYKKAFIEYGFVETTSNSISTKSRNKMNKISKKLELEFMYENATFLIKELNE